MSKPEKVEKPEKSPWKSFTQVQYEEAIERMVHQTFKTTNTNIESGGVRVGQEQAASMPYVGIRSLLCAGSTLRMDRTSGANEAGIYGQIQRIDQGQTEEIPEDDIQVVKAALEKARASSKASYASLSPRIRQIFLPRDDGSYLCVTPLSAAGVSISLRDEINSHNEKVFDLIKAKDQSSDTYRLISVANMPLGGAKPINAGDLIFPMRSPICVEAPSASMDLRMLLSIYHKGLRDFRVPNNLRVDYLQWRNELKGQVGKDMPTREQHKQFISRIAKHTLRLAQDAKELLDANMDRLPGSKPYSEMLPPFQKALLDPSLRSSDWEYDFARHVSRRIAKFERDDVRQFEYTQQELNTIATIARSVVQ